MLPHNNLIIRTLCWSIWHQCCCSLFFLSEPTSEGFRFTTHTRSDGHTMVSRWLIDQYWRIIDTLRRLPYVVLWLDFIVLLLLFLVWFSSFGYFVSGQGISFSFFVFLVCGEWICFFIASYKLLFLKIINHVIPLFFS